MNVKYYYQNSNHSWRHEAVITPLANAISKIIDLPDTIEVCLYHLGKSVYGGIDSLYINRIGLNYDLPIDSIPLILAHELIHVNQKQSGILKITRKGEYFWHGVLHTKKMPDDLPYNDYINLPWEYDAYNRQDKILSEAIAILSNRQHS